MAKVCWGASRPVNRSPISTSARDPRPRGPGPVPADGALLSAHRDQPAIGRQFRHRVRVASNHRRDAAKRWHGAQLFDGGDQGTTAVECGGGDEAIGWITVLKWGAARAHSELRGDGPHRQAQGLQETGELNHGRYLIGESQPTAFMKERQLLQGAVGYREPALLTPLLQGLGRMPADPHRHSMRHREGTRRRCQARPCRAAPAAIGEPPRRGRVPVRCVQ